MRPRGRYDAAVASSDVGKVVSNFCFGWKDLAFLSGCEARVAKGRRLWSFDGKWFRWWCKGQWLFSLFGLCVMSRGRRRRRRLIRGRVGLARRSVVFVDDEGSDADELGVFVAGQYDVGVGDRGDIAAEVVFVQLEAVNGDDLGVFDRVPRWVGHDADHDVIDGQRGDGPRACPHGLSFATVFMIVSGREKPDLGAR